jgi:Cu(I)/Ag(I) efflux system membrane fusion protein
MNKKIYLVLLLPLFILACSSEPKQPETSLEISPKFEMPAEFQQHVGTVVVDYYAFKDALVQSDAVTAAERAEDLRTTIANVPTDTLDGSEARDVWFMVVNEINQISADISNESDVERQRELFVDLTSNIEMMVNAFGVKGISMYKQHCPMAFNDTGANWFSSERKIMNPYFGDRMLHCGTVEQTIAKSGE